MTAIASRPLPTVRPSAAAELAKQRWAANCAALGRHQPDVVERAGEFPADVEWVFARDHSLTCLKADGSWWANCSVPRAAATKLLDSLDRSAMVSAYLAPAYAELLNAARVQMGADPALITIVPSIETLRVLLASGDFAAEITSHRLWFVVGYEWANELRKLFEDHPGLPPAGRFIRTKLTDAATTEAMIHAAQAVLGEVASARTVALRQLQQLKIRESSESDRLLVISPSRFRLWDDAGVALNEAATRFEESGSGRVLRFDSDDPLNASPLALATMAVDSDAVLAGNVYRADAAGLVALEKPWLTWVTRGPVAPFDPAATRDRLIAATSQIAAVARQAGWPASSIVVAPSVDRPAVAAPPAAPHLAIIADLAVVSIPKSVEDLSSHRLLWEFIDAEVDADPFSIGDDPVGYLIGRAGEIGIAENELDVRAFVDGLIVPRWQRAVARLTIAAHVPLRLYGHGWAGEPAVASAFVSVIVDRPAFELACTSATALLHVWPGVADHPIENVARPVVHVMTRWEALARTAIRAIDGHASSVTKAGGIPIIPLRHVLDFAA